MASGSEFPAYEYTTFPRVFLSYRWFKPLFVFVLGFIFMLIFQVIVIFAAAFWSGDPFFFERIGVSYEDMDIFTGPGALVEFGAIAVMIPALALAALIVRDRPFSSYSSSRGGWNWGAFFKCLGMAIGVMGVFTGIEILLSLEDLEFVETNMTLAGLIVCMLLIPFQCVAEEYVFRGLALQTIASWTKLPILGILGSSLLFAISHPYNLIGVVNIFISGAIWGALAWQTKGIEASCALHIVNNMLVLAFTASGLQTMSSEVDLVSLAMTVLIDIVFAVVVIFAGKTFGWFSSKGDGAAAFNEKVLSKRARKQQKRQGTQPQMMYGAYPQQQPYGQPYPPQQPYAQPYPSQPYPQRSTPQPPTAYQSQYQAPSYAASQQPSASQVQGSQQQTYRPYDRQPYHAQQSSPVHQRPQGAPPRSADDSAHED